MNIFTPTAIASASNCMHTWFLECHGDSNAKVELGEGLQGLDGRVLEQKQEVVENLRDCVIPEWDGEDFEAGHQATLGLLRKGHKYIHGGVLLKPNWGIGIPDLLKQIDKPSKLGPFSYLPIELKAQEVIPFKARLQLIADSVLLEPILGFRPSKGEVWLMNRGAFWTMSPEQIHQIDLPRKWPYYEDVVSLMAEIRDGREGSYGYKCSECAGCAWWDHCNETWNQNDDVCLIRSVEGEMARKFYVAGYKTWKDVVASTPKEILTRVSISPDIARLIWQRAKDMGKYSRRREMKQKYPEFAQTSNRGELYRHFLSGDLSVNLIYPLLRKQQYDLDTLYRKAEMAYEQARGEAQKAGDEDEFLDQSPVEIRTAVNEEISSLISMGLVRETNGVYVLVTDLPSVEGLPKPQQTKGPDEASFDSPVDWRWAGLPGRLRDLAEILEKHGKMKANDLKPHLNQNYEPSRLIGEAKRSGRWKAWVKCFIGRDGKGYYWLQTK